MVTSKIQEAQIEMPIQKSTLFKVQDNRWVSKVESIAIITKLLHPNIVENYGTLPISPAKVKWDLRCLLCLAITKHPPSNMAVPEKA